MSYVGKGDGVRWDRGLCERSDRDRRGRTLERRLIYRQEKIVCCGRHGSGVVGDHNVWSQNNARSWVSQLSAYILDNDLFSLSVCTFMAQRPQVA
jgi:hypothetical protein